MPVFTRLYLFAVFTFQRDPVDRVVSLTSGTKTVLFFRRLAAWRVIAPTGTWPAG